ncbi:MAG: DUF6065 family protein [Pseudomonadota bacterium]
MTPPMKLLCYRLAPNPPPLQPSSPTRDWMDASPERFAYRCLPLNIANSYGWEILSPASFELAWNGRAEKEAITITALDDYPEIGSLALSHFSMGVVTFHLGYMFRTPPGWDLLATAPMNRPKHGIYALSGIIETDWLPFPFTMNWKMTAPGIVRFEKGEPICTIIPIQHDMLESFRPEMRVLDAEPELKREYEAWTRSRTDFLAGLANQDPETLKQSWQKYYFQGQRLTDNERVATHKSKLRLAAPEDHAE